MRPSFFCRNDFGKMSNATIVDARRFGNKDALTGIRS